MLKCEKMWALDLMEVTARGCKIFHFHGSALMPSGLSREAGTKLLQTMPYTQRQAWKVIKPTPTFIEH